MLNTFGIRTNALVYLAQLQPVPAHLAQTARLDFIGIQINALASVFKTYHVPLVVSGINQHALVIAYPKSVQKAKHGMLPVVSVLVPLYQLAHLQNR